MAFRTARYARSLLLTRPAGSYTALASKCNVTPCRQRNRQADPSFLLPHPTTCCSPPRTCHRIRGVVRCRHLFSCGNSIGLDAAAVERVRRTGGPSRPSCGPLSCGSPSFRSRQDVSTAGVTCIGMMCKVFTGVSSWIETVIPEECRNGI